MSKPPVSEMTYTVSSETLNPSIPYHSMHLQYCNSALNKANIRCIPKGGNGRFLF